MLQNFKSIGVALLLPLVLMASNGLHDRNASGVDLIDGSNVTNTPYGFYLKSFKKGNIKVLDKMDLSGDEDMDILVGYGVFDKDSENCRYLDVPSNSSFPVDFENIYKTKNATYALSRSRMNYTQCKALTSQYSGYVYTPSGSEEYISVLDQIYNLYDGGTPKDMWIGYSKSDCSNGEYLNDEGDEQSYVNFLHKFELCGTDTQYTYKKDNSSLWYRTAESDQHYCPIKINSPDYLRPIKVCAPWWRVERTWKINANSKKFKFDGREYDNKYMQYLVDYPKEVVICTEVNATAQQRLRSGFTGTCQEYDSAKASPACVLDITLPQCHVDECKGYYENTCVKTDSIIQFKNYDIGYIEIDGSETKTKVKDNKTLNVYKCPPPPLSNSFCTRKEIVDVLPTECPNSQCSELADCLKTDTNTSEECLQMYACEKNYGSVDDIRYNNGKAYALGGVCKDSNTTVLAHISLKESKERRCSEYNYSEEEETTTKKCTSYSSPTNRIVSTSVTTPDIYETNPRCIRTNNISEARPSVNAIFTYNTKGFFKTSIQKAYLDGTTEDNDVNNTEYLLAYSSMDAKETLVDLNVTSPSTSTTVTESFCKNIFTQDWKQKRFYSLKEPSLKGFVYSATGQGTRKVKLYSSVNGIRTISDSYGDLYEASNVGVAELSSEYKIISYKNFDVNSTSGKNALESYLLSLSSGTIIAINTSGDISGLGSKTSLELALVDFGATQTILESLTSDSSYLLMGTKDGVSTTEKYSNTTGTGVSTEKSFTVVVPKALAVSDMAQCSVNASATGMTQRDIAYSDYDFSFLSLNKTDVESGNYCFLGSSQIQGDGLMKYIYNDNSKNMYISMPTLNDSDCKKYSSCLGGEDMNETTCVTHVADEPAPTAEPLPTTFSALNVIPEKTGTLATNFNGYSDVFAIQEYVDGDFGYMSNYTFRLPKNNIILLDGKEVAPIVEQTPKEYIFSYDYSHLKHTQTTLNASPDNYTPHYGFVERETTRQYEYLGSKGMGVSIGSSIAVSTFAPGAVIMSWLSGARYWGWYNSYNRLYQEIGANTKYVENVYGYDTRIHTNDTLLWDKEDVKSGTMPRNDYAFFMQNHINKKHQKYLDMGISGATVSQYMSSRVETQNLDWEGVKWWWASAKKNREMKQESYGDKLSKPVNTIYMGAVNDVTIVVPYRGSYELAAYDKDGNILSRVEVEEQNFITNVPTTSGNIAQSYARVQFATASNFNIAQGEDDRMSNGGCLSSNFVEWGGGVSGAYYEQGVPDLGAGNDDCFKSNDEYVRAHSATKITLKEKGSQQVFNINLVKPLPFPNRVILADLQYQENRKYQCYDSITACTVSAETNATQP